MPVVSIVIIMVITFVLPIKINEKLPLISSLFLFIPVYQLILTQSLPATEYRSLAEIIINKSFIICLLIIIILSLGYLFSGNDYENNPLPRLYQ